MGAVGSPGYRGWRKGLGGMGLRRVLGGEGPALKTRTLLRFWWVVEPGVHSGCARGGLIGSDRDWCEADEGEGIEASSGECACSSSCAVSPGAIAPGLTAQGKVGARTRLDALEAEDCPVIRGGIMLPLRGSMPPTQSASFLTLMFLNATSSPWSCRAMKPLGRVA